MWTWIDGVWWGLCTDHRLFLWYRTCDLLIILLKSLSLQYSLIGFMVHLFCPTHRVYWQCMVLWVRWKVVIILEAQSYSCIASPASPHYCAIALYQCRRKKRVVDRRIPHSIPVMQILLLHIVLLFLSALLSGNRPFPGSTFRIATAGKAPVIMMAPPHQCSMHNMVGFQSGHFELSGKAEMFLMTLSLALFNLSALIRHNSEPACTIPGSWNWSI